MVVQQKDKAQEPFDPKRIRGDKIVFPIFPIVCLVLEEAISLTPTPCDPPPYFSTHTTLMYGSMFSLTKPQLTLTFPLWFLFSKNGKFAVCRFAQIIFCVLKDYCSHCIKLSNLTVLRAIHLAFLCQNKNIIQTMYVFGKDRVRISIILMPVDETFLLFGKTRFLGHS